MVSKMRKSARRTAESLLQVVTEHPVRTAGVAAGAVIGAVLLRKAANTAAKVITIKAGAKAVADIAGAVGKPGKPRGKPTRGASAAVARKAKLGKKSR